MNNILNMVVVMKSIILKVLKAIIVIISLILTTIAIFGTNH